MKQQGNPPGRPGSLVRWVPVASWLPRYQRGWLTGHAIAGFTIWGLLIPEMIAYASLAGLPPQAGLYTLLASTARPWRWPNGPAYSPTSAPTASSRPRPLPWRGPGP
ncbi:MAG: SulP family inorganic anion transporter [Streptosporangiaceae bacterium]